MPEETPNQIPGKKAIPEASVQLTEFRAFAREQLESIVREADDLRLLKTLFANDAFRQLVQPLLGDMLSDWDPTTDLRTSRDGRTTRIPGQYQQSHDSMAPKQRGLGGGWSEPDPHEFDSVLTDILKGSASHATGAVVPGTVRDETRIGQDSHGRAYEFRSVRSLRDDGTEVTVVVGTRDDGATHVMETSMRGPDGKTVATTVISQDGRSAVFVDHQENADDELESVAYGDPGVIQAEQTRRDEVLQRGGSGPDRTLDPDSAGPVANVDPRLNALPSGWNPPSSGGDGKLVNPGPSAQPSVVGPRLKIDPDILVDRQRTGALPSDRQIWKEVNPGPRPPDRVK
jgi:hypothetical protein